MHVTQVIQIRSQSSPSVAIEDEFYKAAQAVQDLKRADEILPFALGRHVQDSTAIQLTQEWESNEDRPSFENAPEFRSFIDSLRERFDKSQHSFKVALNPPAFGKGGPATAKVVEYAQTYFPTSRVTPEFRKQIEEDFIKFDSICKKVSEGDTGLSYGWVLDEQEHEDLKNEKAICFLVLRGWESMQHFEKLVQNEAFKEAAPILFAWNAPFKMWHVERQFPTSF